MSATTKYDVSATAAVAAVRTTFRNVFGSMKMGRAGAPFARTAKDFHIIDKVAFCHSSVSIKGLIITVYVIEMSHKLLGFAEIVG